MKISICVIAYNRLHSLQRLLASLEKAVFPESVTLYLSIDKSDSDTVEVFAEKYKWAYGDKKILLHNENLGLRRHILSCGNLLEDNDALIVLEDDVVVAPGFYLYAKAATERYCHDSHIAGISLYNFPINYHNWQPFTALTSNSDVYLMQNAQSWGQVWMKEEWAEFKLWYDQNRDEFEEQSHLPASICRWPKSSWLKYHTRYCIERNKFFIYPYKSYSTCFTDPGVHSQDNSTRFQSVLNCDVQHTFDLEPTVTYDAFFENRALYDWLGRDESEVCVDYYGEKGNRENKRYWLTRRKCPYKVEKSYALQLKPYELNIKYGIEGQDLFLYDTHTDAAIMEDNGCEDRQFSYLYIIDAPKSQTAHIEELNRIIVRCQEDIAYRNRKNIKHLRACRILLGICILLLAIICYAFLH